MTVELHPRRDVAPREMWIGYDPGDRRGDMAEVFFIDQYQTDIEEEALAAEARRTGIIITIALPAGVVVAWLLDLIAGGPGIGVMVGL